MTRNIRPLNGCVLILTAVVFTIPAFAAIDLELRASSGTVAIGNPLLVGLYAVSDSAANQLLAAADVMLDWDATALDLIGLSNVGAAPLLVSAFPANDLYHLNETVPPQDGDGYYQAFALLGSPVAATPTGTLLTTFEFVAQTATPSTVIDILTTAGNPPGRTRVFDGTTPNLEVTGLLVDAKVEIVPEPGTAGPAFVFLLQIARRRR